MKFNSKIGLFIVAAMFLAKPAFAQTPVEHTCKLAEVLASGPDAIISQFQEMATGWPTEEKAKLDTIFRSELSKLSLKKGRVYKIVDFEPFMTEHLIVSGDPQKTAVIFFRLAYVNGPNGYFFKNVNFNTNFEKIFGDQPLQSPVAIVCE